MTTQTTTTHTERQEKDSEQESSPSSSTSWYTSPLTLLASLSLLISAARHSKNRLAAALLRKRTLLGFLLLLWRRRRLTRPKPATHAIPTTSSQCSNPALDLRIVDSHALSFKHPVIQRRNSRKRPECHLSTVGEERDSPAFDRASVVTAAAAAPTSRMS
jgi:hypothetical protein